MSLVITSVDNDAYVDGVITSPIITSVVSDA
jgi:hypothetical protein